MIAKLCAKDLLLKSHEAEKIGKPKVADEYLMLALIAIHSSKQNRKKRVFSQTTSDYTSTQQGSDEATTAATFAWTEYFTNLFARLPAAAGRDAVAIAEYAKDLQRKVAGISNLAMQEQKESLNNAQQFNLSRRVSPLGNLSLMSGLGAGLGRGTMPNATGQGGVAPGAWQGIKTPVQQTLQTGQRGLQEIQQFPGASGQAFKTNTPGTQVWGRPDSPNMLPFADPGGVINAPYYQNPGMTNKQYLTLNNWLQGSPFLMTTEQIMGSGKGKYAPAPASQAYKEHPALRDPASNEKGFKAMEACWVEYFYKYLPKYGITGGKASGGSSVPSVFATTQKVIKTSQSSPSLPPVPNVKPPEGMPDWPTAVKNRDTIASKKTGSDISAEKSFFYNIFAEVEKRMSGEGQEGATLKGVVKKGALSYLAGNTLAQQQVAEVGGSVAGTGGAVLGTLAGGYTPSTS